MGASLQPLPTFFRHSGRYTYTRGALFGAQCVLIALILRQALAFAYLVATGGKRSYSTLPDVHIWDYTEAAQATSPGATLFALFCLIGIVIPAGTGSLYALLNPRSRSKKASLLPLVRLLSPSVQYLKLAAAVTILVLFVALMYFFGAVTRYVTVHRPPSGVSQIILANAILMTLMPPLAWSLTVCWRTIRRLPFPKFR
jgi:hypothetical protein